MSIIVEEIAKQIGKELPHLEAGLTYFENPSPSEQHSILVESDNLVEVMTYLRDTSGLEFDFLSNVSGVDWPEGEVAERSLLKSLRGNLKREQKIKNRKKRNPPADSSRWFITSTRWLVRKGLSSFVLARKIGA